MKILLRILTSSILFFFIYVNLCTLTRGSSIQESQKYFSWGLPDGCPMEHSNGTTFIDPPAIGYFKNGSIAMSKCDPGDESSWSYLLSHNPDDYLVYPSKERRCFANGMWSNPPPVCLSKTFQEQGNLKVKPIRSSLVIGTVQDDENWEEIKHGHLTFPRNKKITSYFRHFFFKSQEYFDFLTIQLHSESRNTELLNYTVYARKRDIIRNFSDESKNFLSSHYVSFSSTHHEHHSQDTNIKSYAIVKLPVYSKELRVYYSIVEEPHQPLNHHETLTTKEWEPIHFYALKPRGVYSSGTISNGAMCPKPPTIPKAEFHTIKAHETLHYNCTQSHLILVDSLTKNNSDGIVRCLHGKWNPYPLPMCIDTTQLTQSTAVEVNGDSFTESNLEILRWTEKEELPGSQEVIPRVDVQPDDERPFVPFENQIFFIVLFIVLFLVGCVSGAVIFLLTRCTQVKKNVGLGVEELLQSRGSSNTANYYARIVSETNGTTRESLVSLSNEGLHTMATESHTYEDIDSLPDHQSDSG